MKATDISYDLLIHSGTLKIPFEFLKELDDQLCETLERSSFAQLYYLNSCSIEVYFEKKRISYSIFNKDAQQVLMEEFNENRTEKELIHKENKEDFIKRGGLQIYTEILKKYNGCFQVKQKPNKNNGL